MEFCESGNCCGGCFGGYALKQFKIEFKESEDSEIVNQTITISKEVTLELMKKVYAEIWPNRIIVSINEEA